MKELLSHRCLCVNDTNLRPWLNEKRFYDTNLKSETFASMFQVNDPVVNKF